MHKPLSWPSGSTACLTVLATRMLTQRPPRTAFVACPHIEHVVLPIATSTLAAKAWAAGPFEALFSQLSQQTGTSPETSWYECSRSTILAEGRIRIAAEEDYDDLMPLFERQSTNLEQQYNPHVLGSTAVLIVG